ncbi:DNA-binding protein [Hansschlegelia plantiphila]|uniref:Uncharacterized protein n=1 Tax=Hansschlegelia plantiphila TaxID=374655 RepID=A0A9W6MWM2_9HYPH|nr:DNA-binding protein [Hansschlegelia plantiphila]GLK68967.1 hypothetical protein GCM10008179_26050 [Hansschlegelia plantiphila]
MEQAPPADLLKGWKAIGIGAGNLKPDQARHLARTAGLPIFKLGGKTVAARQSSINAWLAEREAAARPQSRQHNGDQGS